MPLPALPPFLPRPFAGFMGQSLTKCSADPHPWHGLSALGGPLPRRALDWAAPLAPLDAPLEAPPLDESNPLPLPLPLDFALTFFTNAIIVGCSSAGIPSSCARSKSSSMPSSLSTSSLYCSVSDLAPELGALLRAI